MSSLIVEHILNLAKTFLKHSANFIFTQNKCFLEVLECYLKATIDDRQTVNVKETK